MALKKKEKKEKLLATKEMSLSDWQRSEKDTAYYFQPSDSLSLSLSLEACLQPVIFLEAKMSTFVYCAEEERERLANAVTSKHQSYLIVCFGLPNSRPKNHHSHDRIWI